MQYHGDYIILNGDVMKLVAEKIKMLREQNNMTQAQLAKALGITRSAVNAYEQSISTPSTQYIVEIACFFGVSTDYLLGLDSTSTLKIDGLTDKDVKIMYSLAQHLRENNKPSL